MASKREQAFVLYYTGGAGVEYLFNGAASARLAGYAENSARITASRLLTKANVKAAIEERIKELTMSADEVLIRLSEQGRGDIGKFIGLKEGEIANHPQSHLIHNFKRTVTTGRNDFKEEKIEIELYNSQAALTHLWKHHQIANNKPTENIDVTDAKERLAQLLARQSGRGEPDGDIGGTE